ncbi:hypothetical protein WJX75_002415 [Coccomyxa subellipsoidea]|uniref:Mediator complex subunit 15 KIX domain-containing protein n=1 Tax=Coccomyxa subellipsoidea TaxID=248742 RepID=A0ABR2YDW0_9CHLO
MERTVTPEKRQQILQQMQAQLVQMMGNVEGMDQHVRAWESQAFELSRGIEKDYIARMATRLQKIENKLQQQKQQQQQQQEQQQQQQQHLQAPQQPVPQQMYQPQPQSHYAQQQIPQHNKQMQPQTHYGQAVTSVPMTGQSAGRMQQQNYASYAMHNAHARQQSQQPPPQTHVEPQHSMGPDSELFADMAQAFILGPSDTPHQQPPQQQQQHQQQPQHRQNMGYGSGTQAYSPGQPPPVQAWQQQQQQPQQQYNTYASPQQPQQQQMQVQFHQGGAAMAPAYGGQPQMYTAHQQSPQMHPQQQQQAAAAAPGSAALSEQYWALQEEMRAEYLTDLEEYAGLLRLNERAPQSSDKMAKMANIIARLSVRREQNSHRQFTLKDVQSMQSLQQQLRLYVAKLRTMLEPVRKQRRQEAKLRQPQPLGTGTPSQTQPIRPLPPIPSAATLQGGKQMPTPPGTSPGADVKPELAVLEGAVRAAWEQETLTPSQRLIRQLAAARPGAVAAAAGSVAAVAMHEGSDMASPPLPVCLRPPETPSDDASHPQEPRLVRSVNVARDREPTSPDSVLDPRAGYKRKRSKQEAQNLQQLRQKVQAECSQLETKSGASFDIQECDDVDGAVIVAATVPAASASEQQQPSTSLRLGPNGRLLRMRVSAGYPAQPPVLLFPEPADAASSHGAQDAAIRGAFEVALAAKARDASVDIRLLVNTWAATLVNVEQMVAGG